MSNEELKSFVASMDTLRDRANAMVIGSVKVELKGTMVYLAYGDKEAQFNTDGYNYIYNMQRLFNNDVISAIIE